MKLIWNFRSIGLTIVLLTGLTPQSNADMTLTAAAKAAGFNLSVFATGFTHAGNATTGVGPLGIAFTQSGVVLVGTNPGDLYRLPNHNDGQTVTSANIVANTGSSSFVGLATIGTNVYVSDANFGSLFQITTTNNFTTVGFNAFGPSLSVARDLRTNFTNGKLLVSSGNGIIEINPADGSSRVVTPQGGDDGMTINESGTTVYLTEYTSGHVLGFNIKTGVQTFDSGYINNGASGTGIDGLALGTGTLAGSLLINDNGGHLWQLNLTTKALTLFGSGGSRGDFIAVDPSDGSLFITQSDRILHLTAPTGSGFGGSIPEPSSYILLGMGLIGGLGIMKRKGRAK